MFITQIDSNVITVATHGRTGEAFVSGPEMARGVVFLGYIAREMGPLETEESFAEEANRVFGGSFPLTLGVSNPDFLGFGKKKLREVALAHLKTHKPLQPKEEGVGARYRRTAFDYRLVRSFGYKHTKTLLAELEGVPVTTISRRLDEAKQRGVLEFSHSLPHQPHLFVKRA
jgi:hypothetical protein